MSFRNYSRLFASIRGWLAPEEDETDVANGKKFPNSSKPLIKTPDGFVFLDPANFPTDFAADLPREQAEFMAHSQMLGAAI